MCLCEVVGCPVYSRYSSLSSHPSQQGSYRKVDVISQEEFDSQRGVDSEPADGDMVFALDLPPEGTPATKPSAAEKEVEGGAKELEGGAKQLSKPRPEQQPKVEERQKTKRPEKRARFYPVLNKQDSQEKVGVVFLCGPSSTAQSACTVPSDCMCYGRGRAVGPPLGVSS